MSPGLSTGRVLCEEKLLRTNEPAGTAVPDVKPNLSDTALLGALAVTEVLMTRRQLRERERQQQAALEQSVLEQAAATPPPAASVATASPGPSATQPAPVIRVAPQGTAALTVPVVTAPVVTVPIASAPTAAVIGVDGTDRAGQARRAAARRASAEPWRPAARTARRSRRSTRVVRKVTSGVALLFVGALFVGTTVPANAFLTESYLAEGDTRAKPEAQQLEVDETGATTATTAAGRDDYTVTSQSQLLRQKYGTRSYSYTPTGTGPVRWPFPYAAPISSGFGERAAPCRGCSVDHKGLDLTGGDGNPIYAIADGVVLEQGAGGSYGEYVYLQHTINGQNVVTRYAHMQWGSSPLVPGERIAVGDYVGLVGSTGTSTGPHLHLEILVNGVHVDPFVWLTANAS